MQPKVAEIRAIPPCQRLRSTQLHTHTFLRLSNETEKFLIILAPRQAIYSQAYLYCNLLQLI